MNYLDEFNTHQGSSLKLKHSHSYYTQVQGQLALTGKTFACFFLYIVIIGYHLEKIDFDKDHWEVSANLIKSWMERLAPHLVQCTDCHLLVITESSTSTHMVSKPQENLQETSDPSVKQPPPPLHCF